MYYKKYKCSIYNLNNIIIFVRMYTIHKVMCIMYNVILL
nr:MAG TPA: hypothetical protein [Caudoviricetes sp.]